MKIRWMLGAGLSVILLTTSCAATDAATIGPPLSTIEARALLVDAGIDCEASEVSLELDGFMPVVFCGKGDNMVMVILEEDEFFPELECPTLQSLYGPLDDSWQQARLQGLNWNAQVETTQSDGLIKDVGDALGASPTTLYELCRGLLPDTWTPQPSESELNDQAFAESTGLEGDVLAEAQAEAQDLCERITDTTQDGRTVAAAMGAWVGGVKDINLVTTPYDEVLELRAFTESAINAYCPEFASGLLTYWD